MKEANRLIFIFPVWWNDAPAIIKGFIDKVMKKQFAYNVGATGVIGHLKNIQRVEGMKHIKWLSFGNIDKSSAQRRKQYLESLVQKI